MIENINKYLPQVDILIKRAKKDGFQEKDQLLKEAINNLIYKQRQDIISGVFNEEKDFFSEANFKNALSSELLRLKEPSYKRVINATGTIIHTNLGRSPLSKEILKEIEPYLSGYSTLEFDLKTGKRGSRQELINARLFEKEQLLLVNNNAAACLLVLATLAKGKEVIVSRGELVEIGGSFRIPDVMELSGCVLKEIGTTNKTKIGDYEKAITDNTALILKVHRSNFRLEGFTEDVDAKKLLELSKRYNIPFYYDIGSGALPFIKTFDNHEPIITDFFDEDIIISFSTDKLLGGCQGGVIIANKETLGRMKKHPLYRAIRPDKFTIYYLERLFFYLSRDYYHIIPTIRMIMQKELEIKNKASFIFKKIRKLAAGKITVEMIKDESTFGGGSLPSRVLPTYVIRFKHPLLNEEEIRRHFLNQTPAVIIRQKDGFSIFDFRTIDKTEFNHLIRAFQNFISNIS